MKTLLENYSLSDILLFLVIFAIALKEGIGFIDWVKGKLKGYYNEERDKEKKGDNVNKRIARAEDRINDLSNEMTELKTHMEELAKSLKLLIASDKDSIKAYITKEHHYFCYKQQWIDDYSLDCLEKRFTHYVDEGGNSFIEELMNEVRALPKQPPQ